MRHGTGIEQRVSDTDRILVVKDAWSEGCGGWAAVWSERCDGRAAVWSEGCDGWAEVWSEGCGGWTAARSEGCGGWAHLVGSVEKARAASLQQELLVIGDAALGEPTWVLDA